MHVELEKPAFIGEGGSSEVAPVRGDGAWDLARYHIE